MRQQKQPLIKVDSKRIALLIPGGTVGQESVRLGIYRFARPGRPWDFLQLTTAEDQFARAAHWQSHGAVGRVGRSDLARHARALNIPFVNLFGGEPFEGLPQVGVDNQAIGTLAADYLSDMGFKHFGYYGIPNDPAATARGQAFSARLRALKLSASILDFDARYPEVQVQAALVQPEEVPLHRWIAQLPKPVALFACDDQRALTASEACRHLGLQVPDTVAILGLGDQDVLCNEAFPPLSSIRMPFEQEGYRAAELLDHLMQGGRPQEAPILLQPAGVTVRQSTDTLAVDDRQLAGAIRFIREHACEGIDVDQVARQASMNRRYLERHFRQYLRRTPFQEIRRVQIERAKDLLVKTDMTIDLIAEQSGFGGRTRLTVEFTKHVGTSPGAYRTQFRLR